MKNNLKTKSDISEITKWLLKFRDERNWEQFHNSKDLALAISIEASELNELFLWKNADEVDENKLKMELADVLIFSLLLAKKHKLNIRDIIKNKLEHNSNKYPIHKSKSSAKKYSEL
jgi:NTP pyrophosphatase (non-canonical NTP hydrolase)